MYHSNFIFDWFLDFVLSLRKMKKEVRKFLKVFFLVKYKSFWIDLTHQNPDKVHKNSDLFEVHQFFAWI